MAMSENTCSLYRFLTGFVFQFWWKSYSL